jgi:RNA polymerase sigma-70 factor (ECF subfamily)
MEFDPFMHLSDETEEREHQLQLLEQALPELKDQQRTCIELFYLKGKSYEEISSIEKMNLNEVKSAIQNGKRNLKILLSKKGLYVILMWSVWMS